MDYNENVPVELMYLKQLSDTNLVYCRLMNIPIINVTVHFMCDNAFLLRPLFLHKRYQHTHQYQHIVNSLANEHFPDQDDLAYIKFHKLAIDAVHQYEMTNT